MLQNQLTATAVHSTTSLVSRYIDIRQVVLPLRRGFFCPAISILVQSGQKFNDVMYEPYKFHATVSWRQLQLFPRNANKQARLQTNTITHPKTNLAGSRARRRETEKSEALET